jgi:hypothetical protein
VTTRIPDGAPVDDEHGRPVDMTTLREDDLLLDLLGRGEEPTGGDTLTSTLARWRATLPTGDPDEPVDEELLAAARAAVRGPRRIGRTVRRSVAVSVAAVLAFGSVAAAAEHAGPGNPLWPLIQLVFHHPDQAREAMHTADGSVSAARAAIDGGRYDQASRLLDEAAASVARIGGGSDADRLREEIAALRARIPAQGAHVTGTSAVPPTRTPSPAPSSGGSPLPTDPDLPAQRPSTTGQSAVPPVPRVTSSSVEVPPVPVPPSASIKVPPLPIPKTDRPIGLGG